MIISHSLISQQQLFIQQGFIIYYPIIILIFLVQALLSHPYMDEALPEY